MANPHQDREHTITQRPSSNRMTPSYHPSSPVGRGPQYVPRPEGSTLPGSDTINVWNMQTNQRPRLQTDFSGVGPHGRIDPKYNTNKPIDFDYAQARRDILANRQKTGFVPMMFDYTSPKGPVGIGEWEDTFKQLVPASQAQRYGYFDDPDAPGKSYFETNPEFKTFFPEDPNYAALAALDEFQESGGGMYDDTARFDLERTLKGDPGSDFGVTFGDYWNQPDKIFMNLGEGADDWRENKYGYDDRSKGYKNTAIHEMLHHWLYDRDSRSQLASDASRATRDPRRWHDEIRAGEYMWNPDLAPRRVDPTKRTKTITNTYGDTFTIPARTGQESYDIDSITEANNFMKMHRLGQQQYEDKWRFQEPGYAGRTPDETWEWGPMPWGDWSGSGGLMVDPRIKSPPKPHFNTGGISGLPGGQWSSSTITGDEEIYDIKPLQMDPGIMSIEDLEDLFEEVGLDKSIIYKLINTGGLSQLLS